jgi:predicted Zn finger-like uncharacterized protein
MAAGRENHGMIIQCKECQKKYNIDERKIVKERERFKCKNCNSVIEVMKPKPNVEPAISPPPESGFSQTMDELEYRPSNGPGTDWEIDQAQTGKTRKSSGMTVGKKLLFLFLSFIVLTGSILTVVYMKYVPTLMYKQIDLRTFSISQSLSAAIQQPLLIKNYLLVNKTAATNAKLPGVAYVSILNKRGIVIAGILGDRNRYNPEFIEKAKTSGFPREISTQNRIPDGKTESASDFSAGGQKIHDVAVLIGNTGGEAHVGLFTEDVEKAVRQSLIPLLVLLLAITLLGSLSFMLVARTISNPIQALTQAAEKISLGQIDLPFNVKGGGEIGELSASLERMRFSIKAAMNRLRQR